LAATFRLVFAIADFLLFFLCGLDARGAIVNRYGPGLDARRLAFTLRRGFTTTVRVLYLVRYTTRVAGFFVLLRPLAATRRRGLAETERERFGFEADARCLWTRRFGFAFKEACRRLPPNPAAICLRDSVRRWGLTALVRLGCSIVFDLPP
jgi:hypothetical protein